MRISDWSSDVCSSDLCARLRPARLFSGVLRLPRGDAGGFQAVHLPRADARGAARLGIDDGVGLDMLGDGPGEQAIVQFLLGRGALRTHLQLYAGAPPLVTALLHTPARTLLSLEGRGRRHGEVYGE